MQQTVLKPYQLRIIRDLEHQGNYVKSSERYLEFIEYNRNSAIRETRSIGLLVNMLLAVVEAFKNKFSIL